MIEPSSSSASSVCGSAAATSAGQRWIAFIVLPDNNEKSHYLDLSRIRKTCGMVQCYCSTVCHQAINEFNLTLLKCNAFGIAELMFFECLLEDLESCDRSVVFVYANHLKRQSCRTSATEYEYTRIVFLGASIANEVKLFSKGAINIISKQDEFAGGG